MINQGMIYPVSQWCKHTTKPIINEVNKKLMYPEG